MIINQRMLRMKKLKRMRMIMFAILRAFGFNTRQIEELKRQNARRFMMLIAQHLRKKQISERLSQITRSQRHIERGLLRVQLFGSEIGKLGLTSIILRERRAMK